MVVDIESMLHFTSFNLKVKLSNNGLCLRCTLMGFEKNSKIIILSNQIKFLPRQKYIYTFLIP